MSAAMLSRILSWITLALPVVAGLAPGAHAARMSPHASLAVGGAASQDAVTVKEIDGALCFSERGGPFLPVPNGPEAAALRDILRGLDAERAGMGVDVGRAVVADGGSGWHGKKP